MKKLSIAFELLLIAAIAFFGYRIVTDKPEVKHSNRYVYNQSVIIKTAMIGNGGEGGTTPKSINSKILNKK